MREAKTAQQQRVYSIFFFSIVVVFLLVLFFVSLWKESTLVFMLFFPLGVLLSP